MNLYLDSSVLLAACGSAAGASRAVIEMAAGQQWQLLSSAYRPGEFLQRERAASRLIERA